MRAQLSLWLCDLQILMPLIKCAGCKDRFPKESMLSFPAGKFHAMDCAITYANEKQRKARDKQLAKAKADTKKKHSKQKRDFYESDTKTRKAAAKKACHDYIRFRDKDELCICCGRALGFKYDAGHFLESGNNSELRYHEDNIHGQSVYCNQYKGGDSDDYEGRLRLKIGDERVDYLLANKGGNIKRSADDYKAIEIYYKDKLCKLTTY
jgi:hypothetical protein